MLNESINVYILKIRHLHISSETVVSFDNRMKRLQPPPPPLVARVHLPQSTTHALDESMKLK
jgi:hypothetical protein